LPATTPFDFDAEARIAYLDAYRDGYCSGLTSLNISYHDPEIFSDAKVTLTTANPRGHKAGMMVSTLVFPKNSMM